MKEALQKNWSIYLIEAWALGMFMVSACGFVILIDHPDLPVRAAIPDNFVRRALVGLAMGLTAVALIYSPWGKKSGAHMNPAVTLANYQLDRISTWDAIMYIIAQCLGAILGVGLFKLLLYPYVSAQAVNYVVTQPGIEGVGIAFIAEFALSLILFTTVLFVSNSKWAPYTGYVAGTLVFLFISFEAPLSGMSINPARTLGSAVPAENFRSFWIYVIAPIAAMQTAAIFYRRWYRNRHGECKSLACFMSGEQHQNRVYRVYRWFAKEQELGIKN